MEHLGPAPSPENDTEHARYLMMGEDGIYTFSDPWDTLPYRIGELTSLGFVLLGVHGINGCNVEVTHG